MREIKFRGKDILNGEWIKGYLFYDYNNADEYKPFITYRSEAFLGGTNEQQIDENTIGQYTGLHDKKGKEIYEGDILRFRFKKDRPECPNLIGFIEYQNQYCEFKIVSSPENGAFRIDDETIIEVIGNIHENSELLERSSNERLKLENMQEQLKDI